MGRRKESGPDKRGGSAARRARKYWMLAHFGTGKTCRCVHCNKRLNFATVQADRIIPGGTYARHNIQPSCGPCNRARSNKTDWSYSA